MKISIPPDFDKASNDQRIAYVQELWDRIASDPARIPIPAHHKRVLDERLADYSANPQSGRPWGEVRDQLLVKLRER